MVKKQTSKTSANVPAKVAADTGRIQFHAEEIGGELVSLLSEGLYSNPLDALREYIQNAIDAKAQKVQLKYTARSLFIRDNGVGMSKDQLVAARRFAVSEKLIATNIGFRGIGIYSAFHLCDTMKIRTKTSGTFVMHTAEYDFAGMRTVLGSERGSGKATRTPLVELLSDYVKFSDADHANEDSFTTVELLGISTIYFGMLSSREDVERYILDTIPVNFPREYQYGKEINAHILAHWEDYYPVSVILQYPGVPDYSVVKRMPPNIERPTYSDVVDSTGKVVAFVWGCRNSDAEMIGTQAADRQYRDLQGFAYKVKGMTVGSRRDSFPAFSQGSLYNWWTGEIHVLNTRVIPNAGRDGFEYNIAGRDMQIAVAESLRADFEVPASVFQIARRSRLNLERAEAVVERVAERASQGILMPTEMGDLALSLKTAEAVARTLNRLAKDQSAAEVRSAALLLKERVKKLLRLAETRAPEEAADQSQELYGKTTKRKRPASTSAPLSEDLQQQLFESDSNSTIRDILSVAGADEPDAAVNLLALLLDIIEETIDSTSSEYKAIVGALQARLNDEGMI